MTSSMRHPNSFYILMAFNTSVLCLSVLFLAALPSESVSCSNIQDDDPLSLCQWWKHLDPILRRAEEQKIELVVSQNGNGNFTTISDAIDSIPKKNKRRVELYINPGVYREKITIEKSKPFIKFWGDPKDPPLITWNATAADKGDDGKPLGTMNSATVAIKSDYFIAYNIKFQNSAHTTTNESIQAVAVRVAGNKAAFYDCSFYGYQDTLYDHKGMHYFRGCYIEGAVDFICGYGQSLYQNCRMHSIGKKVSFLTAQSRSKSSLQSGFSFVRCAITGIGNGMLYLGRPWREFSRVVFSYTSMDDSIMPEGWDDWGDPGRHSTVYYGEYKCSGPGADTSRRVPWSRSLTYEEAMPFIGSHFIQGKKWLLSY